MHCLLLQSGVPLTVAEITRCRLDQRLWTTTGKTPHQTVFAALSVNFKAFSPVTTNLLGKETDRHLHQAFGQPRIGVEAHPIVARICRAKLYWASSIEKFVELAGQIVKDVHSYQGESVEYPALMQRSFEPDTLAYLNAFRVAWHLHDEQSPASELVWLAITAMLRACSTAGAAFRPTGCSVLILI